MAKIQFVDVTDTLIAESNEITDARMNEIVTKAAKMVAIGARPEASTTPAEVDALTPAEKVALIMPEIIARVMSLANGWTRWEAENQITNDTWS